MKRKYREDFWGRREFSEKAVKTEKLSSGYERERRREKKYNRREEKRACSFITSRYTYNIIHTKGVNFE